MLPRLTKLLSQHQIHRVTAHLTAAASPACHSPSVSDTWFPWSGASPGRPSSGPCLSGTWCTSLRSWRQCRGLHYPPAARKYDCLVAPAGNRKNRGLALQCGPVNWLLLDLKVGSWGSALFYFVVCLFCFVCVWLYLNIRAGFVTGHYAVQSGPPSGKTHTHTHTHARTHMFCARPLPVAVTDSHWYSVHLYSTVQYTCIWTLVTSEYCELFCTFQGVDKHCLYEG